MELIYFLRVLLRRKWFILAITTVAILTAFLIIRKAPEVYPVHVRISTGISEQNNQIFSGNGTVHPQRYEIEARFQDMVELIRSTPVLELVSYHLVLHDLRRLEPFRPLDDIKNEFSPEELRVAEDRYQLRLDSMLSLDASDELERKHLQILSDARYAPGYIRRNLGVRRIPGTDFIAIDYFSEKPELSSFVANHLCQEFIRYYERFQAEQSANSIAFYTEMVSKNKGKLDNSLQDWQRLGGDLAENNASKTKAVLDRINRMESARAQANEVIFAAKRVLKDLEDQLPAGQKVSLAASDFSDPTEQRHRRKINELNQRFVSSACSQTQLLDSLIVETGALARLIFDREVDNNTPEDLRRSISSRIEQEIAIEVARERIVSIDRALMMTGSEAGRFREAPSSSASREVDQARDAYLLALSSLSEAKLAASGTSSRTLNQVDFVQPPQKSVPARPPVLILLSGLVSLGLCVIVLFILEYLDRSVKYPSRFQQLTDLPLVGVLNRLHTKNLDLVALFAESQKSSSLETYKQLLRKIRHEIVNAPGKRVLLTSTKHSAGKSALMVSLAYSMSLSQKKVLLIDTNFNNHSLTEITGASPALEAYLDGKMDRKGLISQSVFEGVDVIGCEGSAASPAELFAGTRFQELMKEMDKTYDVILMEGAPANLYVDTHELLASVDQMLLVFAADSRVNERDLTTIKQLKLHEQKMMGAILNKVELRNIEQ
ncbi:MAG: AAA family ATPase [Bacteroidota bacterium]